PRQWGLDAAAAAAFLGLLWPRLKQRQTIAVAAGAAVVALALTPVLMPGLPVLVASVVAIVIGAFNWFNSPPSEAKVNLTDLELRDSEPEADAAAASEPEGGRS